MNAKARPLPSDVYTTREILANHTVSKNLNSLSKKVARKQENVADISHHDLGMPLFGAGDPKLSLDPEKFEFLPVDFEFIGFSVYKRSLLENADEAVFRRQVITEGMATESERMRYALEDLLLFGRAGAEGVRFYHGTAGRSENRLLGFKLKQFLFQGEEDPELLEVYSSKEGRRMIAHALQPLLTIAQDTIKIEERVSQRCVKAQSKYLLYIEDAAYFAALLMDLVSVHVVPFTDENGQSTKAGRDLASRMRRALMNMATWAIEHAESVEKAREEGTPVEESVFCVYTTVEWELFRRGA